MDVRYGADNGPTPDIAPCPKTCTISDARSGVPSYRTSLSVSVSKVLGDVDSEMPNCGPVDPQVAGFRARTTSS